MAGFAQGGEYATEGWEPSVTHRDTWSMYCGTCNRQGGVISKKGLSLDEAREKMKDQGWSVVQHEGFFDEYVYEIKCPDCAAGRPPRSSWQDYLKELRKER